MPTNYPTSLDDLSADNPAANDPVDGSSGAGGKPHHAQHDDLNAAVDALESTVGTTGAFNFARLDAANTFTVGPQTIDTGGGGGNKGLVVVADVSQTANLIEAQAPAGTPTFFIDSEGSLTDKGHVAFGPQSAINGGTLSPATSAWRILLDLEESFTILNRGSPGFTEGLALSMEANPSAKPTDVFRLLDLNISTKAGNAQDFSSFSFSPGAINVTHAADGNLNQLSGLQVNLYNTGDGDIASVYSNDFGLEQDGAGTVALCYGPRSLFLVSGGRIDLLYCNVSQAQAYAPGSIGTAYGDFVDFPLGITGDWFGSWHEDASGWGGTNAYYLWFDAPGVFRVKYDGVMAYYNPAFSPKYTPGGANYERVVQQWNTNVLEYGLEAGGTGTLRKLRLLGTTVEVPGLLLSSGAGAGKVLTSDGSGNASWGVVAGTVTAVSVATANGFAGTSSGGATPALTLTTSITGVLKGDGTSISASNVTDDAQTKAAIVPNTAPSAGQLLAGNAGGTAYAPVTLSGSGATISLASTGVMTISAIANASLANSSITIGGTSTALGGSVLGNVTNDTQTKAAIVPNTTPTAGQILAGNAGGTAYAPVSVSGDATLASTGAATLATVNGNVGSFTYASITVNAKGLVTAAASGAAPTTYSADETTLHLSSGTFSILSTYAGQSSIVTVGTLTGGATGAGFTIALTTSTVTGLLATARGGTGVDNSTGGTANQVWARPDGATGAATYRLLLPRDLPSVVTSLSDAATVTVNWALGRLFDVAAITANRTMAFSNDYNGGSVILRFASGATGAFTPVWPAGMKWQGGAAPTLSNSSGKYDLVSVTRMGSADYMGSIAPNYS